jgi:hypothetical protein
MKQGFIFGNRILDVVFISAFAAQIWKVISPVFRGQGLKWDRIFATGGMPSSHSSTVTALATCTLITSGHRSAEFAISMIMAGVTMYDAAGIRRAAGRHANILNTLIELIKEKENLKLKHTNLKELLGHEPAEVFAGAILGIIIGFAMKNYLVE